MSIWRNYNGFAILHKLTGKPVYLTKMARGDLVLMYRGVYPPRKNAGAAGKGPDGVR